MLSGLLRVSCIAAVGAFALPAHAQPAESLDWDTIRELRGTGPSYEVAFDDDPLNALDGRSTVPRITVRPAPMRVLLIRPRTSFVSSMLKSVEDM